MESNIANKSIRWLDLDACIISDAIVYCNEEKKSKSPMEREKMATTMMMVAESQTGFLHELYILNKYIREMVVVDVVILLQRLTRTMR